MPADEMQVGNSGPLQLFSDFGFVGGEDVAPNPAQNTQTCINWYPEIDERNAKEVIALIGCPGLVQVAAPAGGGATAYSPSQTAWPQPSSIVNLPVRGMYPLPGGTQALVVIASTCYLMTVATQAAAYSQPTFTLTSVGSLLTSQGFVSMTALNGVGFGVSGTNVGTAVLVDGPFGYYYNYLTGAFSQISDPAFLGADRVDCIDGWLIFNKPGSQAFYTNGQQYSTTLNGSYYALKDAAPDNLITIFANKELLWLIGEKTTEVWYDAGGQFFPFQRLPGTVLQIGCQAVHSISRFDHDGQDGLIWFGRSERGDNSIILTTGFSAVAVNTPAFSAEVSKYPVTSDAIGYTYQEDKHQFYVLTFPTADVTWCYDSQSELLHKRLSYDPYAQQYHRHRSNCYMNFQGMRLVGDYQCGAIAQLTRTAYTDFAWPLYAKRKSPHIWDNGQRGRVFMASLQLDFTEGHGVSLVTSAVLPSTTLLELGYSGFIGASSFTDYAGNSFTAYVGVHGLSPAPILSADLAGTYAQFAPFSLDCRAANESVSTAASSALNVFGSDFTIDCWAYPTGYGSGGQDMVWYFRGTGSNYAWLILAASGTFSCVLQSGSGSTSLIVLAGSRWTLNAPHYLKVTRSGNTLYGFIDGTQVGTATIGAGGVPTGNLALELNGLSSEAVYFNGYIGQFRIQTIADTTTTTPIFPTPSTTPNIGTNPQAYLRISRDGGNTFGQKWPAPLGQVGQYKNRTMWRRLAFGRDNVVEVEVIDPVRRDLVGATLKAFSA